jgi:hypothetical protein
VLAKIGGSGCSTMFVGDKLGRWGMLECDKKTEERKGKRIVIKEIEIGDYVEYERANGTRSWGSIEKMIGVPEKKQYKVRPTLHPEILHTIRREALISCHRMRDGQETYSQYRDV